MNKQFADDLHKDLERGNVLEWAELYALDAVTDEERRSIEAFLADSDPALRRSFEERVRSGREAITQAYALQEEEPPAGLLDRILDQLPGPQGTGQEPPVGTGATPAPPVDELAQRRRRRLPGARWLLAAAAAAVVAVGGVTVAQNLDQPSVQDEVLSASDVRQNEFTIPAGGTAGLAVSREENAAVVTLKGVPAPPEGSVYQMWRLPADGSAPVSVGTMTAEDVSGTKITEVEGIVTDRALAITVEPAGGSAAPTLPAVAEIPFQT